MTDNSHTTNIHDDRSMRSNRFEVLILIVKALIGALMLCVGFANIYNLVAWAQDYNQVLVYFGFFLWMSVGGMLFWAGVKGIITKMKEASKSR